MVWFIFYCPPEGENKNKTLCSSSDRSLRGRDGILHLPSNQQKSVWENAMCVGLWIKGVCWANVGTEHDAKVVCFILLASHQQKIYRRKLLSTMTHMHFHAEHLTLSGNRSSDKLFKIMGSQKILTLQGGYQDLLQQIWEQFPGSSSPRMPALHFCRMRLH